MRLLQVLREMKERFNSNNYRNHHSTARRDGVRTQLKLLLAHPKVCPMPKIPSEFAAKPEFPAQEATADDEFKEAHDEKLISPCTQTPRIKQRGGNA